MNRSKKGLKEAGEWHQLHPLFPELAGSCGYGWHCAYAVSCGAEYVLGIDASCKMIDTAKKRNPDPKIEYRVCGPDSYEYPPDAYDFVISNLVLHYIDDLTAIFIRDRARRVFWVKM